MLDSFYKIMKIKLIRYNIFQNFYHFNIEYFEFKEVAKQKNYFK